MTIPLDVTDAWINLHMGDRPPCEVSAARVFASSKMNPGSLVKITCRTREEIIQVCDILSRWITDMDFLADKNHPSSKSKDGGWPIIELKNKSGIMLVVDKKKP